LKDLRGIVEGVMTETWSRRSDESKPSTPAFCA